MPKPSYPLFDFLADLQDVKLIPFPLLYDHGWQIDFPSLYKSGGPHALARLFSFILIIPPVLTFTALSVARSTIFASSIIFH